jgi:hypothetical protein
MALNASVVGLDIVHAGRVENIAARRVGGVLAPGTMATFAADVPLGHLLRVNVISHRVAAIAGGSSWTFHVIGRVVRLPPVGTGLDKVGKPPSMRDIPLDGQGKVIVSNLREIALFPDAAVDERDLVL